jgi:hypothetical protein
MTILIHLAYIPQSSPFYNTTTSLCDVSQSLLGIAFAGFILIMIIMMIYVVYSLYKAMIVFNNIPIHAPYLTPKRKIISNTQTTKSPDDKVVLKDPSLPNIILKDQNK